MAAHVGDIVEITIPRERDFSIVAELVVGGIAARHDVTIEVLDDVQLALASVLEHDEADEGEVSVLLSVSGDTIDVAVGPVGERTVAELEAEPGETVGLRRLLDSTVDHAALIERNGATWLELRKGFALMEPRT